MVINHLSASKLEEDQAVGHRKAKVYSQWGKKKKKVVLLEKLIGIN